MRGFGVRSRFLSWELSNGRTVGTRTYLFAQVLQPSFPVPNCTSAERTTIL